MFRPKMSLDLHKGAKDFEKFHLQIGKPLFAITKFGPLFKKVSWYNLTLPTGAAGYFESYWLFGNAVHWYKGDCKCDGTRTRMYWAGQLDDGKLPHYTPNPSFCVMTTTEKEKGSVRFFVDPNEPAWDNMGGS